MRRSVVRSRHDRPFAASLLLVAGIACGSAAHAEQSAESRRTPEDRERAFLAAGNNRPEIERAFRESPPERIDSMHWIVMGMPDRDLQTLSADYLLENQRLAHDAITSAPWAETVPEEVFLEGILPYAVVDERRDDWRASFRDRFLPLVSEAETTGEAAVILNQQIFPMLGVKYSTRRPKANQSGLESIDAGMASCTGLSVLLIEACRSVGVPARFVGVPLWADGSGNHSWVEVWDDGRWRFTGAAEPTGSELDKGWFTGRAADAVAEDPRRAVWATSWNGSGRDGSPRSHFPMVWSPEDTSVSAVNVTDRYTRNRVVSAEGFGRLYVRMTERGEDAQQRIAVPAVLIVDGQEIARGETRDPRADANDHLEFEAPLGVEFTVRFLLPEGPFEVSSRFLRDEQLVSASISRTESDPGGHLSPARLELDRRLTEGADLEDLSLGYEGGSGLDRDDAAAVVRRLVEWHRRSIRRQRAGEMEERVLEIGERRMPYWYTVYGEPPEGEGRSLFISMHGGGGAPKAVNDRQWENQKRLYKPDEGVYLAPRAPTDTWNLWHQGHIDEFFDRLIENLVVFEGVDPDKVYLMGYSAGGDGVYQLAPRMADRFAAAAMMAGHPNETRPDGLRNLPFTLHMGGEDSAYNRNKIARSWKVRLSELAEGDEGGYPHLVVVHEGKGHWMDGDDSVAVPWMSKHRRDVRPERVVWLQDDVVHDRAYWLALDGPEGRERIVVQRDGNLVDIVEGGERGLRIRVDDDMFDLEREIVVRRGGEVVFEGIVPRDVAIIATTLAERGDPKGVFVGEIVVPDVPSEEQDS